MAIKTLDQPSARPAPSRSGSYPIPLDALTTAGFLGRTERGPVNEPVLVESFPEYCRYFGGHFADGAVSYAVHDFFLHGGRRAVIVRVVNRATRALLEIPTGAEPLRLQARFPGRHEILRVSIDYEQVETSDRFFNLVVQRIGTVGSGLVEDQELYPLISTHPSDMRFIGKVLKDSRLIAIGGAVPETRPLATPPDRPGDPVQYIPLSAAGDDGDELTDYDIIGSDRDGAGLFSFAGGPRIDVLAIPLSPDRDLGSTALVAAARFAEKNRAILIWDPPRSWNSVDAAILGSRRLDFSSTNVMTYFSRIRSRGARARNASGMPASGAIAGMLAQRDRRGLWGQDGKLDYSLRTALTPIVQVSPNEAERLARGGVNAFVDSKDGSMRLVGRVTLGAAGLGPGSSASLDKRRLGFFILNSIEQAGASAAINNDSYSALQRLEGQLRRFFDDLYLRRALQGQTPAQAYYLSARDQTKERPAIRFGFAVNEPGRFSEYAIDLFGDEAGKVRRVCPLEAQQLFS